MTEAEWSQTVSRPIAMMSLVESRARRVQKLRIGLAGCQFFWDDLYDPLLSQAITLADIHLGSPTESECLQQAGAYALQVLLSHGAPSLKPDGTGTDFEQEVSYGCARALSSLCCGRPIVEVLKQLLETASLVSPVVRRELQGFLCQQIREVIGTPHRPWRVNPDFLGGGWIQPDGAVVRFSETAVQLAQRIVLDQSYHDLPILADAVEESGIHDPQLLQHLRDAGYHNRGCWALGAILRV